MGLGFFFEKGSTVGEIAAYDRFFRAGIANKTPTAALEGELKGMGYSYRHQEFLADYRRYGAIAHIQPGKTEAIDRALNYFDTVVEPYRRESGKSMKQVWKDVKAHNRGVYESDEQEIEIEADWPDSGPSDY